jgi:hypothetical protein
VEVARGGGGRWKGGEMDVIHFNLLYYIAVTNRIICEATHIS